MLRLIATIIKKNGIGRGIDTGKWNKIENPKIDPHKYAQLIFDKGAKAVQWRKDILFNK